MDPLTQLTALPMHQQAAAVTFIAYVAYRVLRWTYRRLLTLACMSPIPYGARAAAPLIVSYSLEGDAYFAADGDQEALEAVAEAFGLNGGEAQKVSVTVLVFLTALARAAGR